MKLGIFGISIFTGIMLILISCATGDLDKVGKDNARNNPNDPNGVNYSSAGSGSSANSGEGSSSSSSASSSSAASVTTINVTTYAGSGTAGNDNGTGTAASFNNPCGVAVDSSGNVYVGDSGNYKVRKITSTGVVSTMAGSTIGNVDGTATVARFKNPNGVAVDSSGNVYVGDSDNNTIRKITSAGDVSTFASGFNYPAEVAVDSSGNVYIADAGHNKICQITSAGVVTTIAGSGTAGGADGTGTAATFSHPNGVAVDSSGNVYVADSGNNKIRKITSAGVVTTLAGSGAKGSADGKGTAATFNNPIGVAVDSSGNIYIADWDNHKIRKITSTGVVTTLAGSGTAGSDDGTGITATFNQPVGIAVNSSGNVYVSDSYNHKIRKITQ